MRWKPGWTETHSQALEPLDIVQDAPEPQGPICGWCMHTVRGHSIAKLATLPLQAPRAEGDPGDDPEARRWCNDATCPVPMSPTASHES